MGKLTSKGKYTVKVENHPHTNMLQKPEIVRRGVYKLRDQIKQSCIHTHTHIYIYTHIYIQNLISKLQNNCKPKLYN